MTAEPQKASFDFEVVIPTDMVVLAAKKHTDSDNENVRAVAKALLDLTAVSTMIRDRIKNRQPVDLAPYFDFWFADAITAANLIESSDNESIRFLAKSLIAQEDAILRSKMEFLSEMKRRGIRPNHT